MPCRCSIRRASSPSICTRAPMPRSSTCRIWARCGSRAAMPRARSRHWCRATSPASRRGACATRVLTNDQAGIIDDLMVTNRGDHLHLVVNAARKDDRHRPSAPPRRRRSRRFADRALLALQGPEAAAVLDRLAPGVGDIELHDVGRAQASTASTASPAARAIPARTGSRFPCRAKPRRAWRGAFSPSPR